MARYFLRFRHSDTGLTPTFTFFKKASDLTPQTPPGIVELQSGSYYFDYAPTFDVIFEVDGGASIPTEEVRYISDTIGPRDAYVDEPTSQVKDDVWNDSINRSIGTKGDFVEHVGIDTDAVNAPTVFGQVYKARDIVLGGTGFGGTGVDVKTTYDRIGAPVGATISADIAALQTTENTVDAKIGTPITTVSGDIASLQTTENTINTKIGTPVGTVSSDIAGVRGADNRDLSEIAGTGFLTADDALKVISDNVDLINVDTSPAAIATAVWNELISGHQTAGSMGRVLNDVFRVLKNKAKINATTKQLEIYDDAGVSIVFVFDLKDEFGVASATRIFQRLP
jgi:hypothetical protein